MEDDNLFPAFQGVIPSNLDYLQGQNYMPSVGSAPVGGSGIERIRTEDNPTGDPYADALLKKIKEEAAQNRPTMNNPGGIIRCGTGILYGKMKGGVR